jgi:hypothetical protein
MTLLTVTNTIIEFVLNQTLLLYTCSYTFMKRQVLVMQSHTPRTAVTLDTRSIVVGRGRHSIRMEMAHKRIEEHVVS